MKLARVIKHETRCFFFTVISYILQALRGLVILAFPKMGEICKVDKEVHELLLASFSADNRYTEAWLDEVICGGPHREDLKTEHQTLSLTWKEKQKELAHMISLLPSLLQRLYRFMS